MKRILLAIIAVCAINAPCSIAHSETIAAVKADTKNVVTTVTPGIKRVVKFPFALIATTAYQVGNLIWHNPITEAWKITK